MQETPGPCWIYWFSFDHLLFVLPDNVMLCQVGTMTYICTKRIFGEALVMPAISPSLPSSVCIID